MYRLIPLFKLLIILFSSYQLSAQHILKGSVQAEDGEPAAGVIVKALQKDSTKMIDYTLTGDNGKWELKITWTDTVILEYSMFGFKTEYELIPNPMQVVTPFSIDLEQQSFDLEAVTVKEEAVGVTRVGDTLTFRLTTFTTGAERTLGDVLKRLPGLEIRDGAVFYGGEKITKMLVQGRDIINANHQLATEGIRADQLKEIKIIENYKEPNQQFQTERSEDVAMDVRLKEDQLNKWSGEIEALGGYPSSGKGDINAFNLNDKVGLSGFARINNVGEQVLSFSDMMNMISDQGGRGFHFRISNFVGVPSELNISDRVQANLDAIANLNIDVDVTDKMKIKGFILGAFAERESQVFTDIEYIAEDVSREEEMNSQSATPLGMTMWKLEWNLDSNTFIEASFPFTFTFTDLDEVRVGQFADMNFNTRHENDEWNYNFSPFAKMRRKIGENILNFDTRFNSTRQSSDILFQDVFSFLGVPIDPQSELYEIQQDQILQSSDFNASTNYKMIFNNWFINPSLEYAYQQQSLKLDANAKGAEDFTSQDQLIQNGGNLKISAGYETDEWEIAPSVNINYLYRNYMTAGKAEDVFPGYGLNVARKFNRAHSINLNASYGIQYPSFDNVQNTNKISSATQVNTGGYPIDLGTKGYSASLRYHNFIISKRSFIFAFVSYSYNEDVMSSYSERIDDYILSGFLPTPFSQSFNSRLSIGYELGFVPIRVEPRISYGWSNGFSINLGEQFEVQNYNQSYSLELDSRWDFPLNIEVGIRYDYNIQESVVRDRVTFNNWQPNIELEYKLGNFTIDTDFSYENVGIRGLSSKLYVWDIRANYELKGSPIIFKLEADNILNLDPRQRIRNSFGLNTSQVVRYNVFPGYIVGGLSYKF